MERYTRFARYYDRLSAEFVYRVGRRAGVTDLGLRPGDRVFDLGCGTGLNLPLLRDAVGSGAAGEDDGRIVGLDRAAAMVEVARRKTVRNRWPGVTFVRADATDRDLLDCHRDVLRPGSFDAAIASYALSLMPHWQRAFSAMLSLVRDGGRICVVDMQLPTESAWILGPAILRPAARLACRLGGADIEARPFLAVEQHTQDVIARSIRAGHIQVRTGTVRHDPAHPDRDG